LRTPAPFGSLHAVNANDEVPEDAFDGEDDGTELIVLRASAARWLWVLIGSMVLVTFGAGLGFSARAGIIGNVIGAIIAVVFGYCAVVALRQILDPGSLAIERLAFSVNRRRSSTKFAFADCSRFTTWRNPSRGGTWVVFDYAPDDDTPVHRANRHLMGGSRAINENYGVTPEDLAELLNKIRNAATL